MCHLFFYAVLTCCALPITVTVRSRNKNEHVFSVYGYSADWVLTGNGEKLAANEISAEKTAIIKKILKMSESEIKAVQAFINTLESMRNDSEEGDT